MLFSSINRPGGFAKITKIHVDSRGNIESFDVKYVIETGTETELDPLFVAPHVTVEEPRGSRRSRRLPDKVESSQRIPSDQKENSGASSQRPRKKSKVPVDRAKNFAQKIGASSSTTMGISGAAREASKSRSAPRVSAHKLSAPGSPPLSRIAYPVEQPLSQSSHSTLSVACSDFESPVHVREPEEQKEAQNTGTAGRVEVTLHQVFESQRGPAAEFAQAMLEAPPPPPPETQESKDRREFLQRSIRSLLTENDGSLEEEELKLQVQSCARRDEVKFSLTGDDIEDFISQLCLEDCLMRSDGLILNLF